MNRSRFQNTVSFTGYLVKSEQLPPSKAGAPMCRIHVDNPDRKNTKFNLRIPFIAMGKNAETMDQISIDSLVQIQARVGMHYTNICLYVEAISNLDECP